MTHSKTLALGALLPIATWMAAGCDPYVMSPPSSPALLESAAPLEPGDTGVQVSGGAMPVPFGPTVGGASVRVRHGLPHDVDVSGEGTVHVIGKPDEDHRDSDAGRVIGAVRFGTKWAPFPRYFALTAGVGGGGHGAGGFMAFDAGPILSYENPWLVPFLSGRFVLSQPLNSHPVYLGDGVVDEPLTTVGFNVTAGLRVPFGKHLGESLRFEGTHGSVIVAATLNELYGGSSRDDPEGDFDNLGMLGFYAGGEVVF